MKVLGILLSFIFFSPATVMATTSGPYAYPGYQQPASQPDPGVLLREGIEKVIAFLEGGGASKRNKLVNFVERELAGYFDFVSMTRWSMGSRARFMSNEQRREAVSRLKGMFLNALVQQLTNYEPGRIQYLPPRGDYYSGEMVLSVQTYPSNGYPHRLDFHFYKGQKGWKVYDVAANGLRATSVYREYFNRPSGYNRPSASYPRR